ncbi:hypothetical protein P5673_025416 [Acropora cervicornis]|uniref:Uncharacterized protein n=1 Tax=Acropora cervicornis TaxID=6130 RepID=A0AAD9UX38_ACRCE|nr:hypothetical protein P5673_025416 [Acropora cervicornis]
MKNIPDAVHMKHLQAVWKSAVLLCVDSRSGVCFVSPVVHALRNTANANQQQQKLNSKTQKEQ